MVKVTFVQSGKPAVSVESDEPISFKEAVDLAGITAMNLMRHGEVLDSEDLSIARESGEYIVQNCKAPEGA